MDCFRSGFPSHRGLCEAASGGNAHPLARFYREVKGAAVTIGRVTEPANDEEDDDDVEDVIEVGHL